MSDTVKAVLLREADKKVTAAIEQVPVTDLPDGDVTVRVAYTTLNYKDGMVLNGIGRLVRNYPHIPGVDFSGTVETSENPDFKPGDKVVLTGWRVGEVWWGGYAQKAKVKAISTTVRIPLPAKSRRPITAFPAPRPESTLPERPSQKTRRPFGRG